MPQSSVAGLAPQIENYHLATPSEDVLKLSVASARDPYAFVALQRAKAENAERNQQYDAGVQQTNALRAALMERILQGQQREATISNGYHYLPSVADKGGMMRQIFPDMPNGLFENGVQRKMDLSSAAMPTADLMAKGATTLDQLGRGGFAPNPMQPGDLAGILTAQQAPDMRFDPAATQSGYNARQQGASRMADTVATTENNPDGSQTRTTTKQPAGSTAPVTQRGSGSRQTPYQQRTIADTIAKHGQGNVIVEQSTTPGVLRMTVLNGGKPVGQYDLGPAGRIR